MTHQLLLQLPPTVMHQCGQRQKGEAEDTCRIGGKFVGSPSSWRFCDRESAGENGSSAARRASSPAVMDSARVQRAFLCPGTGGYNNILDMAASEGSDAETRPFSESTLSAAIGGDFDSIIGGIVRLCRLNTVFSYKRWSRHFRG